MSYPGGKGASGVKQQIINQIPPHRVYIEPFLGSGRILLDKRPAEITIGLDLDAAVVAQWESMGAGGIVSQGDALEFLAGYDWRGDEFVYCDPPYLFETRSSKGRIYTCEFGGTDQHERLLDLLAGLPAMVTISGYRSALYERRLKSWRHVSYTTATRGRPRVEYLWMNYPQPVELHDYRYLGGNYRERERLARIKRNMRAKLARMSDLERYAVLSTIEELRGGGRTW